MVYITINYENEKSKLRLKHEKVYPFLKKQLQNSYTVVNDSNNEFVIHAYTYTKQKITIKIKTTKKIFYTIYNDIYLFNGAKNY